MKLAANPERKLKISKTRAWAWSCAYALSENPEVPLTPYALDKEANRYFILNGKAATSDEASWYRHMECEDEQAANDKKVKSLWPEVQGAYFMGPWERNSSSNKGGFVPFWDTLAGKKTKMLKAWNNVPTASWVAWAPSDDASLISPDYGYVPDKFENTEQLYLFANKLIQSKKQIPPLLAFTAWVAVTRLSNSKLMLAFDAHHPWYDEEDLPKLEQMGNSVWKSFSALHVDFGYLTDIAFSSGFYLPNPESKEIKLELRSLELLRS